MPTLPDPIMVVSGVPRSGTSMLMRMLDAGGIPLLTDGQRTADEDNPRGYYELEAVKATARDAAWVAAAPGKGVKVIHALLPALPPGHRYRVIFMHRDLDEVLASQRAMLERSGRGGGGGVAALKRVYAAQIEAALRWGRAQDGLLEVEYRHVIESPKEESARVAAFVGTPDRADAMAAVVEAGLYRNRSSN
ncbi:MAG: sulfotransferase family protein [Phycisphaeraceae bacterium]|nr:sulfotransferase family protein [Phycisphaeraceae bacterium]